MTAARTTHGKRPELKWLPVAKLSVDHRYQRTLESERSQRLIARIAERFHWTAFQAVLATKRPGGGWLIIDGQHRVEAARLCGEAEVPAVVVDASTMAEQASAFVQSNMDRVTVNPFALHRARVAGGDPTALAIDRLCKKAGIEIPPYQIPADKLKPGQTIALGTIARLSIRFGEKVAAATLKAIADAYVDRTGALRAPVIQAVAILLKEAENDERAGVDILIREYLARMDPKKLELAALSLRGRNGGAEFASLVNIIRKAIEGGRALPVAGGSFIKPLTREQLMRGR